MEHLSLEIFDIDGVGSQYAILPSDSRIHIKKTSRLFGNGDVWSIPFTLNVFANSHIFGSAGEVHGDRLHAQLDRRKSRLWVEGIAMYLGYLKLDDEVEVTKDGKVDVTFESGNKTFEALIDGARGNQVPLMNDVLIGLALWRKRSVTLDLRLTASASFDEGKPLIGTTPTLYGSESIVVGGEGENIPIQKYPKMVFPRGRFFDEVSESVVDIDCVNTDNPYTESATGTPTHPYCNTVVCYQKYGYERRDTEGNERTDYDSDPEAQRGYEVSAANRVNSAPNFFVIYWLRCLMKHLGIYVEENQMMEVEDLRRLFFVNTNCAYDEPEYLRNIDEPDARYGRFRFHGDRLVAEYNVYEKKPLVNIGESSFRCTFQAVVHPHPSIPASMVRQIEKVHVGIEQVNISEEQLDGYEKRNGYLHNAFATSDCFPAVNISEIIDALESGFGVRLLFDDNYERVRIVLLRNMFRNKTVRKLACSVHSCKKTESNICGFRMTYGNSEDTHFYYKGFADKLSRTKELWKEDIDKHDYSHWKLDAEYTSIIHSVSAFDKTCYVTPNTGNAYGIKVDKDAKRYNDLHPSTFEFAGFMDAEDGDCSGDEETIKEIHVGFSPAIMNDVNFEKERDGNETKQQFALFIDEQMQPRRTDLFQGRSIDQNPNLPYKYDIAKMQAAWEKEVSGGGVPKPGEFSITSDMYVHRTNISTRFESTVYVENDGSSSGGFLPEQDGMRLPIYWDVTMELEGHVNEGYRLYLEDNFSPNDDGVSPLETHDWGLTLGVMRGSGGQGYIAYSADLQDNEGNDSWELVPGNSATAHPDTCDSYGREWDYTGDKLVSTQSQARSMIDILFPHSQAPFKTPAYGYLTGYDYIFVSDNEGIWHSILIATSYSISGTMIGGGYDLQLYAKALRGHTLEEMLSLDAAGIDVGAVRPYIVERLIIEFDGSRERGATLLELCKKAYDVYDEDIRIDDTGIGSSQGRFSLKLRAEKLNPFFDSTKAESAENRRYLEITNRHLRGRGLADQFYKEYSKFIREARTASFVVSTDVAELMLIDDTERIEVGDVCGFLKDLEFDVDLQKGIGPVSMNILYI